MSSKALRWLVYTELLMTVREPGAMFMSVIMPLAVFLALGFSVGGTEIEVSKDSGVVDLFHVRDVLLAGNIAWVTAGFGIVALPQVLVELRQFGAFRRYRVTPMPSSALIAAPLAVGAAVIVASLALMLVVGWVVFDIRFAGNAAMVALAVLVSYLAFAALGIAVKGEMPSRSGSSARREYCCCTQAMRSESRRLNESCLAALGPSAGSDPPRSPG